MTAPVISVESLNKTYGKNKVVNDISFECHAGTITGLLGPNGSGKSTTMRIMLGLASADSGQANFLGKPLHTHGNPGSVVGALLDPSAHHPGRSVRETIAHAGILSGQAPRRTDEIIEALGLGSVRKRRFGALSLGMKQRVSLGVALISRPKSLILDEPVNGLDIDSARWLREMLVDFSQNQGGAVLISTHLLRELEAFADHLVVISRGNVVHTGPLDLGGPQEQTIAKVSDPNTLETVLRGHGIQATRSEDDQFTIPLAPLDVSQLCLDNRILLLELQRYRENIEDLYLRITEGEYAMSSPNALDSTPDPSLVTGGRA